MEESEKINNFKKFTHEYLTFRNYKNNGLNSIAMYPAMMIDEMQKSILEEVIKFYPSKDLLLLDPFHGAGTSLLIAKDLGIRQIGFDINPLANLITKVKLLTFDFSIFEDQKELFRLLDEQRKISMHSFYKIEKWFRNDIIYSLSYIRDSIMQIKNRNSRLFFWTIFSNIVRKYSNTRSSTFKLHIKELTKINEMIDYSIRDFKKEVDESIVKLNFIEKKDATSHLKCGDSLKLLLELKDESIDIICTSPPYGDNPTTVTYGQFSSLALRWIDKKDLDSSIDSVDINFSSLDKLSLGGRKKKSEIELKCAIDYINSIGDNKKQKVINFVTDYCTIFEQMATKLKKGGYLILTVGNRKVDNKLFPFVMINDELSVKYHFDKIAELKRSILNKRIARKVSKVDSKAVESMSEEYILIYQKV